MTMFTDRTRHSKHKTQLHPSRIGFTGICSKFTSKTQQAQRLSNLISYNNSFFVTTEIMCQDEKAADRRTDNN